ncbi:MAG: hypothetical protein EOM12_07455 [Verrucomicrobiae bacterium]|nr:hypothetical protein [Verrucomicrobiae bacterium]
MIKREFSLKKRRSKKFKDSGVSCDLCLSTDDESYAPSETKSYLPDIITIDKYLLERSRTQWQFGDWTSLTAINLEQLQHHPSRGELALLAASGHTQMGNQRRARQAIMLAREWGCDEKSIQRIIISGMYSTLCRISTITNDEQRALAHCEQSIAIGAPNNDKQLLTKLRMLTLGSIGNYSQQLTKSTIRQGLIKNNFSPSTYDVLFPFYTDISIKTKIGFNTSGKDQIYWENDSFFYKTDKGKTLYLVSNDSGNFNTVSKANQIHIFPATIYSLSGRIDHSGENNPIVWIFQYASGNIIEKNSINLNGNFFQHTFRVNPDTDSLELGLRLAGTGEINTQKTIFRLQEENGSICIQNSYENLQKKQQHTIENAMKQIEASVRLQHYLGPDTLLPDMHNWPISPDFGVLLIQHIEDNDYDAVIEFGSGTSTLILAKALQRTALRGKISPAPLVSFDHLEKYRDATYGNLKKSGLLEHAHVVLGELRSWINAKGTQFQYYACEEALCFLRQSLTTNAPKLLIIVDGPPAATGKHARYPALPIVTHVFGDTSTYHFVMDDYLRGDEREIVALWKEALASLNIPFNQTDFNQLEKQACLLEVLPKPC